MGYVILAAKESKVFHAAMESKIFHAAILNSLSLSLCLPQGGYKDEKSNRLMCMANFCKAQESLKDVTEQHRVTESKAKEVGVYCLVVLSL